MFRLYVVSIVSAAVLGAGCSSDEPPKGGKGQFGGQVIVSGPLRGASVSIDQLDLATGDVRVHVADAMTDDDGRFSADIGLANGILRATASGGSFVDLVTGATVQLDATDQLTSLVQFDLDAQRDDVLVSPVGHLVDARTAWKLTQLGNLTDAFDAATEHLDRHFGNVDWSSVQPASLAEPATSPTEPVRAALVQAAFSVLARDIATAAQSSPQEVNVYTLTKQLAADIGADAYMGASVFDGNDGNAMDFGVGLQVGACAPIAACGVQAGCDIGCGRTLCDLYAGTPRALLAAAMTKVIQDNDPSNPDALNKTQLNLSDTLAIAHSVNDNLDDDLFGNACIEQLDRLPPTINFLAPTPADGGYAGGTVTVKVSAIDDTDAVPRVTIVGYPDADGDPTNSIALAMIDTTAMGDGSASVQVVAVDNAGNMANASRTLQIDNTLPDVTLASTGFLVDGSTWWTAIATPTLHGTVSDASPVTVKAVVNGSDVPGTVTGTTWSVAMPTGALDPAGTQVTIVATDAAGNHSDIIQRIRPDVTAPALSFQTSNVNDEAGDQVTFAMDESPIHAHNGTPVDLSIDTGCASITKYSYLLRPASPTFVTEQPGRNPIAYQLVGADDGVGIVSGSTQYRVQRRDMNGSTLVLDWSSAGTGTSIGAGASLFDVAIQSDAVTGLEANEATYDVDFRATDRLGRTSTISRCFDLHLRAPPMHFTAGGESTNQPFALDTLSLAPGAPYDQIATRLLNDTATGASLLDQPVINGTTETVYLTVTVTKPTSVTASEQFTIRDYTEIVSTTQKSCDDSNGGDVTNCEQPQFFPPPATNYLSALNTTTANTLAFPAKLYELNASGVPTTEIPCLGACSPSDSAFMFAVPARSATGIARRFVVMTMVGEVTNLWPTDGTYAASPSFFDTSINSVRYTGKQQFSSTGCTHTIFLGGLMYCNERTRRTQYRALTFAKLQFASQTTTDYATAPTPTIAPLTAAPQTKRLSSSIWQTTEGSLP